MARTKQSQLITRTKSLLKAINSPQKGAKPPALEDAAELLEQLQGSFQEIEKNNLELKEAVKEAESSLAECMQFFDRAPVGYLVLDSHGKIVKSNKTFEQMLALSVRKMTGKPFVEFVFADDREAFKDHLDACFSDQAYGSLEIRLQKASDEHFWTMLTSSPGEKAGKSSPAHALITIADITEHRNLSEERRQIDQRMSHFQRLESLGFLAGGIAHDFNNLLTIIRGNSELSMLNNQLPRDLKKYLLEIVEATARASKLTDQMLAYAGQGLTNPKTVEISKEITSLLPLINSSVHPGIEVKMELQSDSVAEVDLSQLQQIVMNSVINASEAIGDKPGEISIKCFGAQIPKNIAETFVCFPERLAEKYVCIEISDSGIGMTKDVAAKVFDPFFSTKFTGRGLGMASVLGIVKRHFGAIEQISIPGRGSTFRFYLPAFRGLLSEPSEGSEHQLGCDIFKGRALITEDEPIIRRLMANFLKNMGFEVTCVENGLEGVEFIDQNPEDLSLAIIDMVMPEMDGKEFFGFLRQKYAEVPVVFCSGYSSEYIPEQIRNDSMTGFVQKPFSWKTVEKEIIRLVKR